MRDRDARVGGGRHAGGDAGDDLEGDAGRAQPLGLLTPAAEHERVPSLEADDLAPGRPVLEQQRLDLLLRGRGTAALLAGVEQLGVGPRAVQRGGRDEAVIDDDVGAGNELQRPRRQQARIARAGADQVDGHAVTSASARRRSSAAPAASIRSAQARPTSPASRR